MMEIKITIEGMDQLTEAIALLGSAMAYKQDMITTAVAAEKIATKEENVSETPEKASKKKEKVKKEPEEVTEEPEEVTELTMEDIRAAFLDKNSKANAPKLKALLKSFGVSKVTDLEEKDFESVLKALGEI